MLTDVRYAFRILAKNPGFAAVAVLSLALGIGANTAIFTLVDYVILRSLPVRAPEQLAVIARNPEKPSPSFNYPDYVYIRDHNQSYSGVIAEQRRQQCNGIRGPRREGHLCGGGGGRSCFGQLLRGAGRRTRPSDESSRRPTTRPREHIPT